MVQDDSVVEKACGYCGGRDVRREWRAVERYFGMGDAFAYAECASCGSLNIAEVPANLASFYAPAGYGGHSTRHASSRSSGLRRLMRNLLTNFRLGRPAVLATVAGSWVVEPGNPPPLRWLRRMSATRQWRILDVGCGGGDLLRQLWALGFDQLHGIDKFVPEVVSLPGLTINKGEIESVAGRFDLVMMHHSLEHMPQPRATISAAANLLSPGGWLLVRVPLCDSTAWREYGVDWYQLDAPRHLHVPTIEGLRALASIADLDMLDVDHDSTSSQFVVSEGYRQGLSMVNQRKAGFTHVNAGDLEKFERRSEEVNRNHSGDQAVFYFRRKDPR